MKYITIKDVSVAYEGENVLQDVCLDIYSDDFLGIIGPNGGGKTSLIKAILGLIPFTGHIDIAPELTDGKDINIGYLPQTTDFDRMFPISVIDVILSGLQTPSGFIARHNKRERDKALSIMAQIGISDIATKPIGEISGGQMQRALLCRAIISEPKLLILDEPANFVDNKFEKELYALLKELNNSMAIIMVSHDIGMITSVVKNIVCVNKSVHRHNSNCITAEQLENYECPIQLVSHGEVPHTVLQAHK